MYYPLHLRARERNRTPDFQRERKRRQTTVEGVFASLDRLGWARSRLRGLWKVDCEGFMAAIAHNVLKAVRRPGERDKTPGVFVPGQATGVQPIGGGVSSGDGFALHQCSSQD